MRTSDSPKWDFAWTDFIVFRWSLVSCPFYLKSLETVEKGSSLAFFGCCTADSQTDAGIPQLYNNGSLGHKDAKYCLRIHSFSGRSELVMWWQDSANHHYNRERTFILRRRPFVEEDSQRGFLLSNFQWGDKNAETRGTDATHDGRPRWGGRLTGMVGASIRICPVSQISKQEPSQKI